MERDDGALFQDLWDLAPCALHSLGADGLLLKVNDTWLRWLGYERAQVEGKLRFIDVLTPESQATFRANFPEFVARGHIDNVEFVLVRRDGSTFTALLSATAAYDEQGTFVRSRSCFIDITSRKQQERSLHRMVDAAPDATVLVDDEGRIRYANLRTERLFGYPAAELAGAPVDALLPERLRGGGGTHSPFMPSQPGSMKAALDLLGRRRDGSEFPIEISSNPIETGEDMLTAVAIRDVSDRHQAELVTSRLAAIVDSSDDAVLSTTLDGVITSWNRAAERIYGYPAEEALGGPMAMLIPADREGEEVRLRQKIFAGESVEHFDTVRLRKDGARIDVSITVSPVRDRGGEIVGVSSVARDFSARMQAQAQARLASDRLSDAIECIDEAFALFSADGNLVMHNSAYRALFVDVMDAPLVGHHAGELMAAWMAAQGAEVGQAVWQVDRFAALDLPVMVNEVRLPGHAYREMLRRTRDGGVVLMISDRTADDQREEVLRKASAAKSEFLSSMSHELRTPLNAVLGFGQLLQHDKRTPLSPRQRGMVDHIVKGGEHLLNLIDEVLDLARIESGRVALSLESVSVAEVLSQSLTTLSPLAERLEIELEVGGEIDEAPQVMADRTRLSQILMNFGSNAIKYSLAGGRALFTVSMPDPGHVRVTVRDRGIGIPEASQAGIFQPFYRGSQEASSIEGTGIGLAITRRLADLMGGTVGFESAEGVGSSFWVELRVAQEKPRPRAMAQLGADSPLTLGDRRCSIVYIEDHPANIAFMRELLTNIPGIDLITAPTAELGIELVRAHRPSVVILDINLPGMSGIQALRTLRSWPETRDIPAIGLSAAAMEHDLARAQHEGFYRYLTKPVRVNELLTTLEELLVTPERPAAE